MRTDGREAWGKEIKENEKYNSFFFLIPFLNNEENTLAT
jgi:hypothetical protein